ncbi:hypothetical protein BJ742DRAFT_808804 [Cladochytrium replicatum]|nr:hypothetical protein BJ742DRAFT_808804 [Cladochytrium replicatum]
MTLFSLAPVLAVPATATALAYAAFQVFNVLYPVPPVPRDSRTDKGVHTPINPVIPEDFDAPPSGTPTVYAVLGGGGFLGSYVVYRLLRTRNVKKIYVLDLAIGVNSWLWEGRGEVEFIKTDMTKRDELKKILTESGAEVVLFTAALVRFGDFLPNEYELHHKVNVEGTQNVLYACEAAPTVKYLVHVSSGAVCLGWDSFGKKWWDLDEKDAAISKQHFGHYGRTKALAEAKVRSWDGRGFRCVSLRPYGIFGYGDGLTISTLLQEYSPASNRILNWDYVENVAQALITAADALKENPEHVAGRAFFISDGLPVDNYAMIKAFQKLRPNKIHLYFLPRFLYFALALIGNIFRRFGVLLPGKLSYLTLSTYAFSELANTFVNDAAVKAIGKWRRWTMDESVGRCIYLWELHQRKLLASKEN